MNAAHYCKKCAKTRAAAMMSLTERSRPQLRFYRMSLWDVCGHLLRGRIIALLLSFFFFDGAVITESIEGKNRRLTIKPLHLVGGWWVVDGGDW